MSNAKTNFERFKTKLSFSDIKSIKESGVITTPFPESLFTQYEFHLDQHKLVELGVPAV